VRQVRGKLATIHTGTLNSVERYISGKVYNNDSTASQYVISVT